MPVRVLHLSSHDEPCGVGKYQEAFLRAMREHSEVEHEFFEESPNRLRAMASAERRSFFERLERRLSGFDVLHVQHEFALFPDPTFSAACRSAVQMGKRLVVTLHAAPDAVYAAPRLRGPSPRAVASYLKAQARRWRSQRRFVAALRSADRIIVHNEATRAALIARSIPPERIVQIAIPVPVADSTRQTSEISSALRRHPDDIVLAVVGFLSPRKGIEDALLTLTLLDPRYRLAIVGGDHPVGDPYRPEVDRIVGRLGLADRVYVTGYVEEDARLDALIRECDVCLYPYDRAYYAHASSAALGNAFANARAAVAYPTGPFLQINDDGRKSIAVTAEATAASLAARIESLDLAAATEASRAYAQRFGLRTAATEMVALYLSLASS